jgi:hypothetical protein
LAAKYWRISGVCSLAPDRSERESVETAAGLFFVFAMIDEVVLNDVGFAVDGMSMRVPMTSP